VSLNTNYKQKNARRRILRDSNLNLKQRFKPCSFQFKTSEQCSEYVPERMSTSAAVAVSLAAPNYTTYDV
jgi:hypothetical protein